MKKIYKREKTNNVKTRENYFGGCHTTNLAGNYAVNPYEKFRLTNEQRFR